MTDLEKKHSPRFWKTLLLTSSSYLTLSYMLCFMDSYLPEMVMWFGYRDEDKGHFVFLIYAVYFIGAFLATIPVSWISEKLNHYPVYIAIYFWTVIVCLCLAFATHYTTVLVLRFSLGVIAALHCMNMAIIAKLDNHAENVVVITSATMAYTLGINVSTAAGGYLASPTKKYVNSFGKSQFFHSFPYCLPAFLGLFITTMSFVVVILFFPKQNTSVTKCPELNKRVPILLDQTAHRNSATEEMLESTELIKSNISKHNRRSRVKEIQTVVSNTAYTFKMKLVKIFGSRDCRKAIILYIMQYVLTTINVEIFAIWLSTATNLGGIGYTTNNIGSVLMAGSLPAAFLQMLISPKTEQILGSRNMIRLNAILVAVTISVLPTIRFLSNQKTIWYLLVLGQFLIEFGIIGLSIPTNFMVSNSASVEDTSFLFSIARMMAMITKSCFSIIVGSIYRASIISNIGSPIDTSLAFVFIGFALLTMAYQATILPKKLEVKASNFEDLSSPLLSPTISGNVEK